MFSMSQVSVVGSHPQTQRQSEERRALIDNEKWGAVLRRDGRFDGVFVLAVRSTGIYCKPSCPARHPKRENVMFFSSPDEAERHGFRPCRRCKPQEATRSPQMDLIDRVCKYMDSNLDRKLTLSNLSSHVGISQYHLQRIFKRVVGISPRQYVEARRLAKMKRSLRNGETVTKALYGAGFSSRSRLYEKVPNRLGVNPGTLRRGGQGLQIDYTIVDSPLGRLLVGSTERGICAVCMGSTDAEVENALSDEYPSANLHRNDGSMRKWVTAFMNYFTGQPFSVHLPVDVQATAFQWRVWKEIQAIPYGQTRTYSKIASHIGAPSATRAVANACATNRVALVIPCHRVIGQDGQLHGYRWGKKRKQTLLSLEQTTPNETQP